MDSNGPCPDGIRFRGCPIRSVPSGVAGWPAESPDPARWLLTLVRHGSDLAWNRRQCLVRLEPHSIGSDVEVRVPNSMNTNT